jgi:branched-chain amino acid transport system substrate-binding protein
MSMTKRLSAVLALAMAAALMIPAGCRCTPSPPKTTGPKTIPGVLRLGVAGPLTQGSVVMGKGIQRGVEMAISDFNASGEARAQKLSAQPFVVDDQDDPRTAIAVAGLLAKDPNVIGVVGHYDSACSIQAAPIYSKAGMVMVSPASTDPALTQQRLANVFRVCTIDPVEAAFGAGAAYRDLGLKTAVVVDDSTAGGAGLAANFAGAFTAVGGKVVLRQRTSAKDRAFTPLVAVIKKAKPDLVFYAGPYYAGEPLAKQMRKAGVTARFFVGAGAFVSDFAKNAGGNLAEGDLATSFGVPVTRQPGGKVFQARFHLTYPKDSIEAFDTYGYDAATTILKAAASVARQMGAAKVTTVAGKQAVIAAVAKTDYDGVSGRIKFDAHGDIPNHAITLYVVKGGVWVPWTKK